MNHETTIKRIQELVPSVMDWEFGCRYIISGEVCTVNGGNYRLTEDKKGINITSLCNHPKYTKCCNAYQNIDDEPRYYSITEILGKPITLAVVVMAIKTLICKGCGGAGGTLGSGNGYSECWDCGGQGYDLPGDFEADEFDLGDILKFWNLSKDNFNDQPEETKEFIGELLTNNK